MTGFDLDSPVGRRMVEAMEAAFGTEPRTWHQFDERNKAALAAALRVAEDDTCPTCGGIGFENLDPAKLAPCPNPDCKDGQVRPALVEPDAYRAQVVAEIVAWLGNEFWFNYSGSPDVRRVIDDLVVAIERHEELSIQRRRKP